jgi:hypothetical protein
VSKYHWNITLTAGDVDFLREVAEFVNDILDTVEDETDEDDD